MTPATLKISRQAARRFLRRSLLLDAPVPDVEAALRHHGYIQIDPINVCGRMHDLILRNRVAGYREGGLTRHLHGAAAVLAAEERIAFEHHLPSTGVLVAFSLEAWPHLHAAARKRSRVSSAWSGRLTPREKAMAERALAAIGERGPLSPDALADGQRTRRGWGTSATLAKSAMQKLFFHGQLLISHRESNRRVYNLPERILPAAIRALAEPAAAETERWLAILKLRQHRLVRLKRAELRAVEDLVQAVAVEDCPLLHCLKEDEAAFAEASAGEGAEKKAEVLLLAPLDPLIYDRRVLESLWDFRYTWEVYVPPTKRQRGYYALPVLAGTELVGHVDPKADREAGRLRVVGKRVKRGHPAGPAVGKLAAFLGLRA